MSGAAAVRRSLAVLAMLCVAASAGFGQGGQPTAQQAAPAAPSNAQLQEEIGLISAQLTKTQQQLQQSQEEVLRLQQQLAAIQAQLAGGTAQPVPATATTTPESTTPTVQELSDKVDVIEAQVKLHDQTKVESVSKYQVRFTGLILFNSFLNKGTVDNVDLPSVASATPAGTSNVTTGASIRQTILGVQVSGPHLFGAASSGEVNMDFYGGIPYSNYNTVSGIVRLRTAALRLTWPRDTVEAGFVEPLISPLEPTSYAAVAEPAMAWAGNLWTWAPQLSYEHRFGDLSGTHATWQFGLWDPPTAGYNADQLFRAPSPGERSGQPAYESRMALVNDKRGANGMQLGLGGYYSRQSYTGRSGDSWAVTSDWRMPVGRVFEVSGEVYRGRALGGLGGGGYKDVETGTDPITGASTFRLLNDAGGWTQAKVHFGPVLEANGAFGMDDAFSRDFHSLVLSPTAGSTQLRARNRMVTANLVYSPKTYLIFSPEFRRIWTWGIFGPANTANVMTLSLGLRF